MTTIHKLVYCARCGGELSPDEVLNAKKALCAYCDHMHSEALEFYVQRLKDQLDGSPDKLEVTH